jgi:hypothetical protein
MTPTEKQAQLLADELMNIFILTKHDSKGNIITFELAKTCALMTCIEILRALNSLKGMGKIQKVKLYKLVKKNLEAK